MIFICACLHIYKGKHQVRIFPLWPPTHYSQYGVICFSPKVSYILFFVCFTQSALFFFHSNIIYCTIFFLSNNYFDFNQLYLRLFVHAIIRKFNVMNEMKNIHSKLKIALNNLPHCFLFISFQTWILFWSAYE